MVGGPAPTMINAGIGDADRRPWVGGEAPATRLEARRRVDVQWVTMNRSRGRWWRRIGADSRWLALGLGVKRWLLLLGFGASLIGLGVVYLILMLRRAEWLPPAVYHVLTLQFLPLWARIVVAIGAGAALVLLTINRLSLTVLAPFRRPGQPILESLVAHSQLHRGPHIVAIGGGTGLAALLRGLREHTANITAIVTVADDGGSSGRLRRELGMLPPGDIRSNMAALARDEELMTRLLQYRFSGRAGLEGGELHGHAFGNLLLVALAGITGSFDEGLLAAERVLALRGRVMPSTLDAVRLVADKRQGPDGPLTRIVGESAIPEASGTIENLFLEPVAARPYPPALQALFQADLILLGPGSLYTSILPNLLVPGLADALRRARAPVVYICNVATQPGETDNYTVAEHVAALTRYLPPGTLDIVLANNNLSVPPDRGGGQTRYVQPTEPAEGALITADLVDEEKPWRHDSEKLAGPVLSLLTRRS